MSFPDRVKDDHPTPADLAAPAELYAERSRRFSEQAEYWGGRSRLLSNLRGLCFGALVIALITAFFSAQRLALLVGLLLGLIFVALMVVHSRVLAREELALRFLKINQNAHARVTSAWQSLTENGSAYLDPAHPYAGDLDLFGAGSVYQRFSVAHTRFGQDAFARFLALPVSSAVASERQALARALAPELEYRQKFEAQALSMVLPRAFSRDTERLLPAPDPTVLLGWAEGESTDFGWLRWGAWALPLLTVTAMLLAYLGLLPTWCWALPLVVQVVVLSRLKVSVGRVFFSVSHGERVLSSYGPLLELVESPPIEHPEFERLRARLVGAGTPPSVLMRRFARIIGFSDLRNNPLVYPFINAILLWDVHCLVALYDWKKLAGNKLRGWFEVLGEVEAHSSLAGIAHDNPEFSWPKFQASAELRAEDLGHPLLASGKRIGNDLGLSGPGRALLVTGSNMSGKSTLLRALGVNQVLALAGAPVSAREFHTTDFVVRTSIRMSDSLEQGVSHFYAELKKLKVVMDSASQGAKVLFLLDEVLHGTNSEERQVGARWMLARLLEQGAIGAVSTHDSGLCQLPPELMSRVEQVHFRETVHQDRMTFDYKLRSGPVQGGNALRLMRVLGLDVPLTGDD